MPEKNEKQLSLGVSVHIRESVINYTVTIFVPVIVLVHENIVGQ